MKDKNFEKGPISQFKFYEDESDIILEIPEEPVCGWTMKNLNSKKVFFY